MTKGRRIAGKIDAFSDGFLRGWVFDASDPRRRLCVDVFAGSVFLGQAACGFHRPDLEALGFGDGRHEFLIALDPSGIEASELYVRVSSAPHVILRLESAWPDETPHPPPAHLADYFEPLLAGLQRNGAARPRSRHARFTESTRLHGVPLSRFSIHIARKFGYDIEDERQLRAFLVFYFERYVPYRAPYRVPLAPDESRHWTSAVASETCRAAAAFAPRRGRTIDRIYGWATNDAARLDVDDVWVGDDLIASLQRRGTLFAAWQAFPMNRFLRRFARENAALDGLRWSDTTDRQVIYAAVVLHAARSRALLKLLPTGWAERMIERDAAGHNPLEQVLTRVLGRPVDLDLVTYRAILDGPPSNQAAPAKGDADIFDIQLIGPFDRILGLAESCRRIARAIAACGYRAVFTNYDIGNASPQEARSELSSRVAQARINVLHLNLEEIPEALAFSLAALDGSYLIAVPYFELSETAKSHALGLELIDEIWAPTLFLKDLFGARGGVTHLMPLPTREIVEIEQAEARSYVLAKVGRAEPIMVFLATADALSWVGRKHTIGVVDAFQAAFARDEPVCLLLKTHNIDRVVDVSQVAIWAEIEARRESDPRIVLMNETISGEEYQALLSGVDCLVSLHRAEGLGLDILDAMTLGTAVVATAYSGNLDLCDETTSWPVAFDLVPVGAGNYPFAELHHQWAEPRLPAAVSALRDVYARPDERRKRSSNARSKVRDNNDLQVIAARIRARVEHILSPV